MAKVDWDKVKTVNDIVAVMRTKVIITVDLNANPDLGYLCHDPEDEPLKVEWKSVPGLMVDRWVEEWNDEPSIHLTVSAMLTAVVIAAWIFQ